MSICPFAKVELLPGNATQGHMTPTATVWHSAAPGGDDLYGWWMNPNSGGLNCHFYINSKGELMQYIDTNVRAFANVQANAYGISVETQNNPNNQFDADPWTDAQIAMAIKLQDWICEEHSTVPKQLCTDGVHGIGWHEQYPEWTTPGHHCPGTDRVDQLQHVIIPAVISGQVPGEDELSAADVAAIQGHLDTIDTRVTRVEAFVMDESIRGLYKTYLGREPLTITEIVGWRTEIAVHGKTFWDVMNFFATCDEHKAAVASGLVKE